MAQQSGLRQENRDSRHAAADSLADHNPRDAAPQPADRTDGGSPRPADPTPHALNALADARDALARVEQSGELSPATLASIRSALFALEEVCAVPGDTYPPSPASDTAAPAPETAVAALETTTATELPDVRPGRAGETAPGPATPADAAESLAPADLAAIISTLPADARPHWDRRHRVLKLGPVTIKKFRHPARNQERLLNAFEDLGWPEQIDDLSPRPESLTGVRLNDTIRQLNRHQQTPLLRFGANGKANGVRWWIRKAK